MAAVANWQKFSGGPQEAANQKSRVSEAQNKRFLKALAEELKVRKSPRGCHGLMLFCPAPLAGGRICYARVRAISACHRIRRTSDAPIAASRHARGRASTWACFSA